MRIKYKASPDLFNNYYKQQGQGLPYFQGRHYQQGFGIGSVLAGLFRSAIPLIKKTALPILKKSAKVLGKEALSAGSNILKDVVLTRGKVPIKKIIKRHGSRGIKRAARKIITGKGYHPKKIRKIQCASKINDILN